MGKDNIAKLRGAVPDPYFDVRRHVEAELLEHASGVDNGPGTVRGRLVPNRRQPENRPWITGTEGADYHVVDLRCILDDDHVLALSAEKSKFSNRFRRIGE